MKIIDILPKAPNSRIRLDPIDPEDLCVDLEVVQKWSRNNSELLHQILENGMASFICNKEYIYKHYEELTFIGKNLTRIDQDTLHFRNLRVLNLSENNIAFIENIPHNVEELYLDFNQIKKVGLTKAGSLNLHLLSISHNNIKTQFIENMSFQFSNLISLNVASNAITDIKLFVKYLKKFHKLKILNANDNPISLLKIYYEYITENLELRVIDGEKYVKPQPPKKIIPKPEVKEEPKEEKKDPKKDAKKVGKQPEPPKEQPKPQPIVEIKKKQLTEDDFTKCSFQLNITNFQNFIGNLYDPSIFPPEFPVEKTQTTYWIEYCFMDTNENLNSKKVRFDQATVIENEPNKLTFSLEISNLFETTSENKGKFVKGILITVHSEEPSIETIETGEQKPIKDGNDIVMKKSKIGEIFVDLRDLLLKKDKTFEKQYRLWEPEICSRPYFQNPFPNEEKQISKRKDQFEEKLRKEEQERAKQLEEQQAAKNQKKGGKDPKKVEKKPAKKQGKQVVSEKKAIEKSSFPLENREYCYLNENKIYKAKKQTLAVKVIIQ